jgi:hypothetical protein
VTNESPAHELGSPGWIASIGRLIEEEAARHPDRPTFSFSEEIVDAPAHLVGSNGRVGFTARVVSGRVDFEPVPAEDVDVYQRVDYVAASELVKLNYAESPEESAATKDRHMAAGRIVSQGQKSQAMGEVLGQVHDRVVPLTTT